ncbi:hypothetical protein V501_06148 [Pseudogymnoascus sp. VKM F-4519 (FW-2642)]|nr:hypothetical protein V501_06148 [Pseudogymnoascus sp. VKM F-4519 (FW-2642)]
MKSTFFLVAALGFLAIASPVRQEKPQLPLPVGMIGVPGVQTDAQILEAIKGTLQTVWHASSTCKMGPSADSMAVVDSHARVYGVKGVRVVDASAFPFLPPGHPRSTIYALAEKIADLIKNGQ